MLFAFPAMSSGRQAAPEDTSPDAARNKEVRRLRQQRAPIAQLLLLLRLRARNRRDLARDSLERAAHVLWVTCKNWFSLERDVAAPTPVVTSSEENPDQNKPASANPAMATSSTESPHAHRHD